MTYPEKQHRNDCSTCDAVQCPDCTLVTPTHWHPRGLKDSRLSEAFGAEDSAAATIDAKARSEPVDYYDGDACMDACRLACRGRSGIEGHLVASAIQYLWRSGRKGAALPDVLKARDMVDRLVRELGGDK